VRERIRSPGLRENRKRNRRFSSAKRQPGPGAVRAGLFTKTFLLPGLEDPKRFIFGFLRVTCQKKGVKRTN
jgi:hypothetical protein